AARGHSGSARAEFLDAACKSDPLLRREIDSLLETEGREPAVLQVTDTIGAASPTGAYRILEEIGVGGMGTVYRARDETLARDVALKILPEPWTHDPDRLARFAREARVLASLNHPHIAAIHGVAS